MNRVVEFFAGMGGLRACLPDAHIVRAVDINQAAAHVHRCNFDCPYDLRDLSSIGESELRSWSADFWWLSPPCQPFSRRGRQRDVDDPRSAALSHLTQLIGRVRPPAIGLENVGGFLGSTAHHLLLAQLTATGYHIQERQLCPTQLGWPNRRPRYYLLASRSPILPWQPLPRYACRVSSMLQSVPDNSPLWVDSDVIQDYFTAIDRVDAADPDATTACFASSYGKVIPRAGSYLLSAGRYRRFAPREVARLLGFGEDFCLCLGDELPEALWTRKVWKLLGNSLSLPVVRYVLSHLPLG